MSAAALTLLLAVIGENGSQLKAATINVPLASLNPNALQTILDNAAAGDIIMLPSTANATGHKVTWSGYSGYNQNQSIDRLQSVVIRKGLTIVGAGTNENTGTVIENDLWSDTGTEPSLFQIYPSVTTGMVEIRNIRFTSTAKCAAGTCLHGCGDNCLCANCAINSVFDPENYPPGTRFPTRVRIHDCVFEKLNWGIMVRNMFGVVDHCVFIDCEIPLRDAGYPNNEFGPGKAVTDVPPFAWDSMNTWCMEDCFVLVNPSVAYKYFADTEWPAAYTIRHCTYEIHRASPYVHGYDGPDMHGTGGAARENNVGIKFYKNIINYWTDGGMNFKLCDIRGGTHSLVYNNTLNILDHTFSVDGWYSVVRADPTGSIVPTPTYIWDNYSIDAVYGTILIPVVYDSAVITPGINFKTVPPSDFAELRYPHPLANSVGIVAEGGYSPANQTLTIPSGGGLVVGVAGNGVRSTNYSVYFSFHSPAMDSSVGYSYDYTTSAYTSCNGAGTGGVVDSYGTGGYDATGHVVIPAGCSVGYFNLNTMSGSYGDFKMTLLPDTQNSVRYQIDPLASQITFIIE